MICPNKNLPEWIALEAKVGEQEALQIFKARGYELPSLSVINKGFNKTKPLSTIARDVAYTTIKREYIEKLKSNAPNIRINEGYYNDHRPGWIENGEIYINLSIADSNVYVHEYGHIHLHLMKEVDPKGYKEFIGLANNIEEFESIKTLYPDYSDEDQRVETIMYKLEQYKKDKSDSSIVANIYRLINKFLKSIGLEGMYIGPNTKFNEYLDSLYSSLLNNPISLTSEELKRSFKKVMDKRVKTVTNVSEFIESMSGRSVTSNTEYIRKKAIKNFANPKLVYKTSTGKEARFLSETDSYDKIGLSKGTVKPVIFSTNDPKLQFEEYFNAMLKAESSEVSTSIEEIKKAYNEVYAKGSSLTDKDRDIKMRQVFRGYEPGDSILEYKELATNGLDKYYIKEFDTNNILVKIRNKGPKVQLEFVMLTNEYIGERSVNKSIIGALNLGGRLIKGNITNKLLALAKNIRNTDSVKNLATVHLGLLQSILQKNTDAEIKSNKIVRATIHTPQFAIEHIHPTTAGVLIKKLLKIDYVEDILEGSTLYDMIYESKSKPNTNLNRLSTSLLSDLENVSADNHITLKNELLKEYKNYSTIKSDTIDASIASRSLESSILKLMEAIHKSYPDMASADLLNNSDYVVLAKALYELQTGLTQSINPYYESGVIEANITSAHTQTNPYFNWWFKAWENGKYVIRERYNDYMLSRNEAFNKLKDDVNGRTSYKLLSAIVADDSKYYKHLLEQDVDGRYIPKFKDETTLSDIDKEFVKYYKSTLKEAVRISYFNEMPKNTNAEFEEWFKTTTWNKGYIPLIRSSVSTQIFEGNITGAVEGLFKRMVEVNPFYDYEQGTNTNEMPNYLMAQSDERAWEEKLLGLQEYEGMELDLRKVLDMHTLHSYKMYENSRLIPLYKAASTLIRLADLDYGVLDMERQLNGKTSRDEEVLKYIYEYLVFHKMQPISEGRDEVMTWVQKSLEFSSTLTTYLAIGISPLTDLKTFAQSMVRIMANGMANHITDERYDMQDLFNTMYGYITNPGKDFIKALELGKKLGVINSDLFDLMSNRWHTDESLALLDRRNIFLLPRLGDNLIKAVLLTAMMKHDKTWEAWDVKKNSSGVIELIYDKNKDIEVRGEGIVNLIERNFIKETGYTELDTTHDGNMRRTYEKRVADILGGYPEGTVTALGTKVWGQSFTKFKKFMNIRIEKAIKGEVYNEQEGDYGYDEEGKAVWLNQLDTGIIRSFIKASSTLLSYVNGNTDFSALTPEDKSNIGRVASYMLWFGVMTVAYGVLYDEEEDKNEWSLKVIESVINDMSLVGQMDTALSMVKSPFTSVFYTLQLFKGIGSYFLGDVESSNDQMVKQIGILRSMDAFTGAFR